MGYVTFPSPPTHRCISKVQADLTLDLGPGMRHCGGLHSVMWVQTYEITLPPLTLVSLPRELTSESSRVEVVVTERATD